MQTLLILNDLEGLFQHKQLYGSMIWGCIHRNWFSPETLEWNDHNRESLKQCLHCLCFLLLSDRHEGQGFNLNHLPLVLPFLSQTASWFWPKSRLWSKNGQNSCSGKWFSCDKCSSIIPSWGAGPQPHPKTFNTWLDRTIGARIQLNLERRVLYLYVLIYKFLIYKLYIYIYIFNL